MIFCTLRASKIQRPIERCDHELRNSSDTQRYNFWSTFEFRESSHVTDMHAVSILIHLNFSSKIMITWFQTVRKLIYDPPSNRPNWIKSENSNSQDQKMGGSGFQSGSKPLCICVTWLPFRNSELDQKLYPRVLINKNWILSSI